jgi:hypothetical protein
MGKPIIDTDTAYRALQSESLLHTYDALGLTARLPAAALTDLKASAAHSPATAPRPATAPVPAHA